MLSVSSGHFLCLCLFLFFSGLYGVLVHRREILVLLLSSILIFVSAVLLFIVFGYYHQNSKGQLWALIFLGAMLAMVIIALALILTLYKKKKISFSRLEQKDDVS